MYFGPIEPYWRFVAPLFGECGNASEALVDGLPADVAVYFNLPYGVGRASGLGLGGGG